MVAMLKAQTNKRVTPTIKEAMKWNIQPMRPCEEAVLTGEVAEPTTPLLLILEMLETVVFSVRMEVVFSIIIEAMDVSWVKSSRRTTPSRARTANQQITHSLCSLMHISFYMSSSDKYSLRKQKNPSCLFVQFCLLLVYYRRIQNFSGIRSSQLDHDRGKFPPEQMQMVYSTVLSESSCEIVDDKSRRIRCQ
jgi:hypothetical protein